MTQALPPAPGTAPGANAGARPLLAFFIDLLLALAAMLGLGLAAGIGWGVLRGVQVGLQAGGALDAAALAQQIGQPGPVALVWITLVSTGGTALLLYFWRRRATAGEGLLSRQAASRASTWGWALLTGGCTFLASTAITALSQHWGEPPQPSNVAMIEDAFSASPLLLLAFALVAAPVYEELLFRRVLFGRLWGAGRPLLGLVLSSLAFALLHEIPGVSGHSLQAALWLWLVYALMGAAFAGLYWHTRTLWAPIAAHALNNGIALAALLLHGS